MTADQIVEAFARGYDLREMDARRCGAFDAAVSCQQFAEWLRGGTLFPAIRGASDRTLIATYSDGLVELVGDALLADTALSCISRAIEDAIADRAGGCDG